MDVLTAEDAEDTEDFEVGILPFLLESYENSFQKRTQAPAPVSLDLR